jgi:hypothetical protein
MRHGCRERELSFFYEGNFCATSIILAQYLFGQMKITNYTQK